MSDTVVFCTRKDCKYHHNGHYTCTRRTISLSGTYAQCGDMTVNEGVKDE